MDSDVALVDVLLLADCDLYERYPELVQRVDYFLYEWSDRTLARTASMLRRQSRRLRVAEQHSGQAAPASSPGARPREDDESFTHTRSVNIVWRQWVVKRLQLPQYPPERINWNKDADPVFLYGQVPALRLEVPWSIHSATPSPPDSARPSVGLQLKPALKRTDLQTFLTSPTLSPASSPLHSPAMSLRECMSTSSFGSDDTLESECALKPRLRFNDRVEQCMVVFDQEKEYLSSDDDAADSDSDTATTSKRRLAAKRPGRRRTRCSLVIKLAPTHLKGDHRKLVAVSTSTAESAYARAGYDSDEEALFGAYDDSFAMFGNVPPRDSPPPGRHAGTGVSGYVQGCVKSVAGQVRKMVSDAVMPASYTRSSASQPAIVSDPYAAPGKQPQPQLQQRRDGRSLASRPGPVPAPINVVRDPYSAAADSVSSPCDRVPFDDDDEDAIINEFEREMKQCAAPTQLPHRSHPAAPWSQHTNAWSAAAQPSVREPPLAEWDMDEDDNDMYQSEYQLHMYDGDRSSEYASELGPAAHVGFARPMHASLRSGSARQDYRTPAAAPDRSAAMGSPLQPARNDSIIDRAEDTIVNTVDAVKWCASFITNYTIF
ncbi:protein phosphatase regulator [Coemansia spiralis]|nr:protein phosphatase regulator [Coemansia spiralis]